MQVLPVCFINLLLHPKLFIFNYIYILLFNQSIPVLLYSSVVLLSYSRFEYYKYDQHGTFWWRCFYFSPWRSGVKSTVLAPECSNSPDPSGWAAARGISFSVGVSMLLATLTKVTEWVLTGVYQIFYNNWVNSRALIGWFLSSIRVQAHEWRNRARILKTSPNYLRFSVV